MVKNQYPHIAAVAGDYDDDGDMDLFIVSGSATNELYRNDQSSVNNWIKIKVNGYPLNHSSIGAKVKIKATINGKTYWQFREISAQNSFNGHNSLISHFGLGNAAIVDSIIVEWLSGSKTVLTNVPSKQQLNITENGNPTFLRSVFYGDVVTDQVPMTVNFTNLSFGDSNSTPTTWKWDCNNDGVFDGITENISFTYTTPDTYSVKLIISDGIKTDTLIRSDYIIAQAALPNINVNTSQHHFGNIDVNTEKKDTTIFIYNNGKGSDSIGISVGYVTTPGTVKPDSAIFVTPKKFFLAAKDSHAVTFTIYPRIVLRTSPTITYTPKIVITSKNNNGSKIFEKNMFFKLTGTLLGIVETEPSLFNYALDQNFPNPFNPSTIISYQLPTKNLVSLKVFDALGREVDELVNEIQSAGVHLIKFNGEKLSSGLYFYRLHSGNYSQTRKLMLLK